MACPLGCLLTLVGPQDGVAAPKAEAILGDDKSVSGSGELPCVRSPEIIYRKTIWRQEQV